MSVLVSEVGIEVEREMSKMSPRDRQSLFDRPLRLLIQIINLEVIYTVNLNLRNGNRLIKPRSREVRTATYRLEHGIVSIMHRMYVT